MHLIARQSSVWFTAFALIAGGAAQAATHMGQLPSDHVTLSSVPPGIPGEEEGGCPGNGYDFYQILPNGDFGQGPFRIPARKVLVVTDVDWFHQKSDAQGPGSLQTLRLLVSNLADDSQSNTAFSSTVRLDDEGLGSITEYMTTGFVVSSAARVCPDVFPGNLTFTSGANIVIRGYLTTER